MKRLGSTLKLLLKVGLSAVLLVLLFRMVKWDEAREVLTRANAWYLLLAVILLTVERAVSVLKWLILIRVKGSTISFWRLFLINYVGGFWALFIPSSVSADIIRGYYLSKKTSDVSLSVSSIVVDHILALFGLVLVGAFGAFFVGDLVGMPYPRTIAIVLTVMMLAGYVAIQSVTFMSFVNKLFIRRMTFRGMDRHLTKWFESCVEYGRYPVVLFSSFALSILVQAIRVAIFYVVALGFAVTVPITYYFAFVPVINLAIMLPVFNGIGVREACFMKFAGLVNVAPGVALVVSTAVSIVTTLTTALGGIIYLFDRGMEKQE